jgi:serine/threonine protein phosphatase PrpC
MTQPEPPPVDGGIDFALRSVTGPVRRTNEDAIGHLAPDAEGRGHVFAVCDGMGGEGGGQIASASALDTFLDSCRRRASGETTPQGLANAVQRANDAVADRRRTDQALAKMGTTLTAVAILDGSARLVHVGDSACYIIRDRQIRKLTNDHSVVGDMVRAGMLTEEQARRHPDRSRIRKYLGKPQRVEPDLTAFDLAAGDTLVLASDGLTAAGLASADVLGLVDGQTAQAACDRLIEAAMQAGAPDNVSVAVIRYQPAESVAHQQATTQIEVRSRRSARSVPPALVVVLIVLLAIAAVSIVKDRGTALRPGPSSKPGAAVRGNGPDMKLLREVIGADKTLTFYRRTSEDVPVLSGPGRMEFIVEVEAAGGREIWQVIVDNSHGDGFIEKTRRLFPTDWDETKPDKPKSGRPATDRPGE